MKRFLQTSTLIACAFLCSTAFAQDPAAGGAAPPPPASSGGYARGHGIGVGGIAYLSGLSGLSVAYDPGIWHLDTMLGISGDAPNILQLGARFWYHVSSAAQADLSIGAGVAYQRIGGQGGGPAVNNLGIEAGGLIRIFLVQNVAFGVASGLVIYAADANGYQVGNTNTIGVFGNASLHYFF